MSFHVRKAKTRRGAFPGLLRVLFLNGVQIAFFGSTSFRLKNELPEMRKPIVKSRCFPILDMAENVRETGLFVYVERGHIEE